MLRQTTILTPLPRTELLVRQFTYTEELGRPFQLDVELLSPNPELTLEKLVSERLTVGIPLRGGTTRFFNGVVSEFWQTDPVGRFAAYRATVVPWLSFLTYTADCRIFQDLTIPEILQKVFAEYGFNEVVAELKARYRKRDYCVQYRESDFAFVSRLMEEEGIYYFWRHSADRHELVLVDDLTTHQPYPGYPQLPFRPAHGGSSPTEFIASWMVRQKVQPAIVALTDYNPEKPGASLLAKSAITRRHSGPPWEVFDYPGEYEKKTEGDRYAQIRIQELQSKYEIVSGKSDARGISAGCQFTLERHPREDQNRKYLVTGCEYTVREELYEAGAEGAAGFDLQCTFRAIDAREQFRSTRTTPRPVIQGPQTAMVVGQKGKKIDVDPHGRVKVQFHWDRYGKRDANSSCWIRVSQPWAGSGYGGMIIPRIGHEVIVEFLEGDPDRPIITGRVYNGDAKPDSSNAGRAGKPGNSAPTDIVGADVMTSFRSESLGGGGGNEITMNDTAGAEGMFLHALKDEIHNVGNDREDSVGNNETRRVGNDRSLDVTNNEAVKIGVNASETVGVAKVIDVGTTLLIKAGTSITLQCGAATIHMNQAGIITISGTMITIAGAVTCNMAAPITNVVGGVFMSTNSGLLNMVNSAVLGVMAAGATAGVYAGGAANIVGGTSASIDAPKIDAAGADIGIAGSAQTSITGGVVKIN